MTIKELEKALDTALNEYNREANETLAKYRHNPELHDAIDYIYQDTFRCLQEFRDAIIDCKKRGE